MQAHEVWPWLSEDRAALMCRDLTDTKCGGSIRVPVEHRPWQAHSLFDVFRLRKLPRSASAEQLRAVLKDTGGIGLYAPKLWPWRESGEGRRGLRGQAAWGSIIVWPPSEWKRLRSEFMDWQHQGIEQAFEGVPYCADDVLIFASINFSPDGWFIVRRGPMAGKIVFWTHDGDWQKDVAWAEDLRSWGERVRRELPEIFGGVIRFDSTAVEGTEPPIGASDPAVFEAGSLYPEAFETGR